jgi:hypothetical protein
MEQWTEPPTMLLYGPTVHEFFVLVPMWMVGYENNGVEVAASQREELAVRR